MTKPGPGRPTKFNPAITRKLVDAIAAGTTYESACRFAGISYVTFRRWLDQGEQAKSGQFSEFCEAIKEAEGRADLRNILLISKHAEDDWHAAAWLMERRHPQEYGRTVQQVEHSGGVDVRLLAGVRAAVLKALPDDAPTRVRVAEALEQIGAAEEAS